MNSVIILFLIIPLYLFIIHSHNIDSIKYQELLFPYQATLAFISDNFFCAVQCLEQRSLNGQNIDAIK